MKIELVLDWPPSQGSYYAYNRRTRYVTAKGKKYQLSVAEDVFEQCGQGLMLEPPLEFSAIFYPPDKRVWDFDNHLKALQDSLTLSKVWTDDSAISQLHCYQGVVIKRGRILLRIESGAPKLPLELPGGSPFDLLG